MSDTKIKFILDALVRSAETCLVEAKPIVEYIKNHDDVFYEDLKDAFQKHFPSTRFEDEELTDIVEDALLDITNYSQKVLREIEPFERNLLHKKTLRKERKSYPFLYLVWNGDVYDSTEIEALKKLNNEIDQSKRNLTERGVIEMAVENYRS